MYEYIIGKVTFVSPYYIVVETNGIGYQISVDNPYRYSGKMDTDIKLYLHQVVREDAQLLFGFGSLDEKQLFLKLISVSGIGPKSGLAIMASVADHGGLINAIEGEDVTYLTKFPGVGKKTAQQMILDLKGKLGELESSEAVTTSNQALAEALEALSALGYSDREIKRITKQLEALGETTTDVYLSNALKFMMKR
ncbi:Holliday junction branch migration protein RuvA [Enterococcus faecalis]|uniref:Holliday junction branch migration protein RuvA n=1 Tax=Enterococcus faecalis TaxID=1351 RepID=UPI0002EF8241|nr:Holliday junction branch migration protein RuvA [Enterococcus faecalis]